MLAALLALIAQQHGLIVRSQPATYKPWPVARGSAATVDLGVTTAPLARNEWRPWRAGDLSSVNAFEQAAKAHASVVMWYADWQHNPVSVAQLAAVAARGSTPEITWEPWDASKGLRTPQPAYTLRSIVGGQHDAYIRAAAEQLAAWGKPVRLRFAQEMNGTWYPWDESANSNHAGEFVQAWRHVHGIFALAGASNVQWVWSPASGAPRAYWPGKGQVDILGLTCLNGGSDAFGSGWRSFASICGPSVGELHALAPKLPIEISEAGSAARGGSQADWIAGMFKFIAAHREVSAVNWFEVRKETDWQIESSSASSRQFALGVRAADLK
jgi:hypothetical protein